MEGLDLIPWRMLAFSSLWIIGLAIILTALGFADYHASVEGFRARDVLRQPGYKVAVNGGLAFFCLGLLGSSGAWWESAIWGLLALAFAYYAWEALRQRRAVGEKIPPEGTKDPPPGG